MLKIILPAVLVVVIALGGLGYYRYTASKSSLTTPTTSEQTQSNQSFTPIEVPKALPQATVDDRVKSLEDTINKLVPQVNSLKAAPAANNSEATKIASLEASITELKARVSLLEKGSTTTTSSNKTSLYIPLGGSSGTWTNSDWTILDEFQISLDPANFPGYTSMQLEAILRVVDPSGTESVRLYNSTDGSSLSTQLDTTSTTYVLKSSSTFTLPTGSKTYKLQAKDSAAKEYYILSARLKVNY
jgi:hypothetical protein